MRLALAVATLVAATLAVAVLAGIAALLSHGPLLDDPWRPLSLLRVGVLLVLLSGCWLVVNGPLEGRTLFVITHSHGVTAGDLVVVPVLALAAVLLLSAAGS